MSEELELIQEERTCSKILHTEISNSPNEFVGKDVCIFAIFSPHGQILPGTKQYIKNLTKNGILVIACITVNNKDVGIERQGLESSCLFIARMNSGFDFGTWSDVLRSYPNLWSAKRLFFANDSVLALPEKLDALIAQIRESDEDFIALTDCFEPKKHAQSYFFVLKGISLKSLRVRSFWDSVIDLNKKKDVINTYEINLLSTVESDAKLSSNIFFGYASLFRNKIPDKLKKFNPCHFFWERLLDRGFPFVKVELFRDNPSEIQLATSYLQLESYGADIALFKAHISQSRNQGRGLSFKKSFGFIATLKAMNRVRLRMRRLRLEKESSW